MYSHRFDIRVRYADADQMGYVYYGNYAKFYEIGRVETIRSLGLAYKDFETQWGIMLPVVYCESKFLKPALYDDILTIDTSIREFPGKMVVFHCNIYNENNELINEGVIKLFFVDIKTGKRISAPFQFIEKIKPYFGK